MAKKILAVVLAVMMAVSAMAVSAFADNTIYLYPSTSAFAGAPDGYTYSTNGITLTWDLPIYALYGYTTNDYALELNLPTDLNNVPAGVKLNWAITVNGHTANLAPTTTLTGGWNVGKTTNQYVYFASLLHDYVNIPGVWTSVPQSTAFNDTTSIRITCTYNVPGQYASWKGNDAGQFGANGHLATAMNIKAVKANTVPSDPSDTSKVEYIPGAVTYAQQWKYAAVDGTNASAQQSYDFVTDEWTVSTADSTVNRFTFDHDLKNRGYIMDAWAAGSEIELHVPLNKEIVGQATYTLYASKEASNLYDTGAFWWLYDASRTFVDEELVTSSTKELVFTVSPDVLYNGNYGGYNKEFVIFENILLMNQGVMKDYMNVDRAKVGNTAGSVGSISWGQWSDRVLYNNKEVNYARSGKAGYGHDAGYTAYPTDAASIKATETKTLTGGAWTNLTDYQSAVVADIAETDTIVLTGVPEGVTFQLQVEDNGSAFAVNTRKADGSMQISGKDYLAAKGTSGWINIRVDQGNLNNTPITITVYTTDVSKCGDAVTSNGNVNLGADVVAVQPYILIKGEEVTEPAPEDVTPPTEGPTTEDDPEQSGDLNVEDDEPEAPAQEPEKNPTTGIAFAVVPMMIAAAAAVISKKH